MRKGFNRLYRGDIGRMWTESGNVFTFARIISCLTLILCSTFAHAEEKIFREKTYVDIHAHTACFREQPVDSSAAMDINQTQCYLGNKMRKGFNAIKLSVLPEYFGLVQNEDFRKKGTTLWLDLENINKSLKVVSNGKVLVVPRAATQKYTASDLDYYIFEVTSRQIQKNKMLQAAVVMAMDQVYSEEGEALPEETPFFVSNRFVIEGLKSLKQKTGATNLLYAGSVHPFRRDALRELEYAKANGAKYVKIISSVHGVSLNGEGHSSEAKKKLDAYYAKLVSLKLPLMVHIDEEGTFGHASTQHTGAFKIEYPLRKGVTVIVSHMASKGATAIPSGFVEGAGPLVRNYDQLKALIDRDLASGGDGYRGKNRKLGLLLAEISVLPMVEFTGACGVSMKDHETKGDRKHALAEVMGEDYEKYWKDRILYGSDYPLNHAFFRPRYCFTSVFNLKRNYKNLFDSNSVSWTDTNTAASEGRHWDHDFLMKKAFGVPPEVFERYQLLFP